MKASTGFKRLLKAVVVCVTLGVAHIAYSATFNLKSGVTDWTLPGSYAEGAVPASGDTVNMPAETFAMDADSASFAKLTTFGRLVPQPGTRLVITVNSVEKTLCCAFCADSGTVGELVKRGLGRLKLGSTCAVIRSSGYAYDYCTNLTLEEGELSLVQEPASFSGRSHYGIIRSSGGTTLFASAAPERTSSIWAEAELVYFDGTVTNANASYSRLFSIYGKAGCVSEVNGVVGGKIRFWTNGSINFRGENSTFSETVTTEGGNEDLPYGSSGAIGVSKFGMKSDAASSLGTSASITAYGRGGFRYLGSEQDETDKIINAFRSMFLDGGLYGGMVFSGNLYNQRDSVSNEGQKKLVLYGSNTLSRCTFSGKIVPSSDLAGTSAVDYSFYVVKRGIGTWLFSGPKAGGGEGWTGGLAIEEGTFQFDSLAKAGTDCSLGRATRLTDGHVGPWLDEHMVDYAVALGSESPAAPAVFEYVGAGAAECATRPIALVGQGGTIRADGGALSYSGISARDANAAPVLTLDGTSTKGNEVRNVSAGAEGAKVGVEKTGTGTWKIGGDFTLGGDIKVREGTLSINVPQKPKEPVYKEFKWFRLSFAELANSSGTAAGQTFQIRQIGLFDKDGIRQNVGLTVPTATIDNGIVQSVYAKAGEAVYDRSMTGMTLAGDPSASQLQSCFSGLYSSYTQFTVTMPAKPEKTNPSTWMKIVMHLPDSANPITHFDVQGFQNGCKEVPWRLVMEGSANGHDWTTVYSNLEDEEPHKFTTSSWNPWISDGVKGEADNRPLPTEESHTGFLLSVSGAQTSQEEPFSWFRLSVAEIHNDSNRLIVRNIHLFDKNGNRQNAGLVMPAGITAVSGEMRTINAVEIGPGQVYYDPLAAGLRVVPRVQSTGSVCDLPAAFNGLTTSDGVFYIEWRDADGNALAPTPSNPDSWIPITMHLQPYTSPISHFDVQALYYDGDMVSGSKCIPIRMKVEGSCDGKTWTTVYSNVDEDEPLDAKLDGYNRWISDGATFATVRPLSTAKLTFAHQYPEHEPYDQHLDGFVEVQSGARIEATEEIEIGKLRVDANGAGTLAGFAFSKSGVLDIRNYTRGMGALPVTFESCSGVEDLSKWGVQINGVNKPSYRLVVSGDGKVCVVAPGMMMIVR